MRHKWNKIKEPSFRPEGWEYGTRWDDYDYIFCICDNCKMIRFKAKKQYKSALKREHAELIGYYINKEFAGKKFIKCADVIVKAVLE